MIYNIAILTVEFRVEKAMKVSKRKVSLVGHLAAGASGFNASEGENEQCDERGELHILQAGGVNGFC